MDTIDGVDATQQLVGRVGKLQDIAEMVMFLCSDKAGFITLTGIEQSVLQVQGRMALH